MSKLVSFNFNQESVRAAMKSDGTPLFVAKDIAEILGYPESKNALALCKYPALNAELNRINNLAPATKWIPESDVYRLVMRSHKPEAVKFQDWVVEEVLPSIRKTGSYSTQTPQTYLEALKALVESEEKKQLALLEAEKLRIELDKSKEFFTIKRVAQSNSIDWRTISWRKLKAASENPEQDIVKIFDANYGHVNAYHDRLWAIVYPELELI